MVAIVVTHSKTLVSPDSGTDDKVYGADYVSPSSHTVQITAADLRTAAELSSADSPTFAGLYLTPVTWAQLLALGAVADGQERKVSDVGANGSWWSYNATDARWRPMNGVLSLLSTAIPMVLLPSSNTGANGAVTIGTALPATYAAGYFYVPAGKAYSGSAAGAYFGVMSDTTHVLLYDNLYAGGAPTIPASPTPIVDAGPGAWTQTTGADITLLSYTVRGGLMGNGGRLTRAVTSNNNNSAGTKTTKDKLGGTTLSSNGSTTAQGWQMYRRLRNMGTAGAQSDSAAANGGQSTGQSTGAPQYLAIATGTDQTYTVTSQLSVATDYNAIIGVDLELGTP